MYTRPAPLYETARNLRDGTTDLLHYIQQTCAWLNLCEPKIQALIPEENREARLTKQANHLLDHYPDPSSRPPLFGVLIGVKDIFIANGFPMRAGSKLPAKVFAGKQASSVTKLLDAGAIILGKTVTTEFAYFAPGPTRNPHNPEHTPGGSSSGSAAALAAGFCSLSLGTQTIGSVIRPGAYCGIYGFKPSFGEIATDGVLPCSQTVDHVGYFAQDIEGLALAASVLIPDWQSKSGVESEICLGIPEGPYLQQADATILSAFRNNVLLLESAGIAVKHIPMFEDIEEINTLHKSIVAAEFADNHAALYQEFGHLYAPQSRDLLQHGLSLREETLLKAYFRLKKVQQQLSATMRSEGITGWICPASRTPAPKGISSTGDPIMNLPWTYAGVPALSIPAGVGEHNLPLSLQLVADYGRDAELLQIAKVVRKVFSE